MSSCSSCRNPLAEMYFNITSPPGFAIPRDKLRVVATDIEGCRFVFKLEQYQQHRELPNMECIPFDYIPREMVYKAEESSPDSHTGTWVSDGRDFPSSPWYDSNDYMVLPLHRSMPGSRNDC